MLKILSIVGARPQIIKAAALSRIISLKYKDRIEEVIIHSGQHYDFGMSNVFFDELAIPQPKINLSVGSGSHAEQTAEMLSGIEKCVVAENPDVVVVYGDTNTTLSASLAAAKLKIPLAHIEAGLRSFNKKMPEEINRVISDHCSTFLFAPTITAIQNLHREGFSSENTPPFSVDNPGVFHSGDIMLDNTLYYLNNQISDSKALSEDTYPYCLLTVHRENNTENPERLFNILSAIVKFADTMGRRIKFPVHPRTKSKLDLENPNSRFRFINNHPLIEILEPLSFLETLLVEKYADVIFTDSGGVQKEAYFLSRPTVILRNETEWLEIVNTGTGILVDDDETKILNAGKYFIENPPSSYPSFYGEGKTAEFICNTLLEAFPDKI